MEHELTRIDADPRGRPGIAVLALRGDVDACDRPALDLVRTGLARARQVHVDVAGVRHAGATFLGFVAGVATDAHARSATLNLHDVPDRLVRLLNRVGMQARFDLAPAPTGTLLRLRPAAPSPAAPAHA